MQNINALKNVELMLTNYDSNLLTKFNEIEITNNSYIDSNEMGKIELMIKSIEPATSQCYGELYIISRLNKLSRLSRIVNSNHQTRDSDIQEFFTSLRH